MMISLSYSHRLASVESSVEAAQLGGACESQNPAKGAHPSQPSPGAIPYPFLCPRPGLRSTKPPGAAWRAKMRRKMWHGLNRSPWSYHLSAKPLPPPWPGAILCADSIQMETLNFTLFIHSLFPFLSRTQTSNSTGNRISGLQLLVQVLLPRAITPAELCWKGKRACLLITVLFSCPGRCGCWATWCMGMKEPCELSPSLGRWGTSQCQCCISQRVSWSCKIIHFYASLWAGRGKHLHALTDISDFLH